jgi:hypothetical protein
LEKCLNYLILSYNFFLFGRIFLAHPFYNRATKEQKERILLFAERYKKITEERGHHAAQKEAFAACDYSNALYVCLHIIYVVKS